MVYRTFIIIHLSKSTIINRIEIRGCLTTDMVITLRFFTFDITLHDRANKFLCLLQARVRRSSSQQRPRQDAMQGTPKKRVEDDPEYSRGKKVVDT